MGCEDPDSIEAVALRCWRVAVVQGACCVLRESITNGIDEVEADSRTGGSALKLDARRLQGPFRIWWTHWRR